MCDDKVFDRFTSGMTAGKERFRCAKWRWWHIRVRQRQRRCSAPNTYLVFSELEVSSSAMMVVEFRLGTFKDTRNDQTNG